MKVGSSVTWTVSAKAVLSARSLVEQREISKEIQMAAWMAQISAGERVGPRAK